jgi:cell fate regulator YaaT (PSP1 superfamily)
MEKKSEKNQNSQRRYRNHHNSHKKSTKNREKEAQITEDDEDSERIPETESPAEQPEQNLSDQTTDTDDQDAPSAEDIKAELESRKGFKKKVAQDDVDHTQAEDWEKYLDLDIRTGLSPESEKIAKNIFLTRGLSDTPDPEKTHCEQYHYDACKLPTYNWMDKLDISFDYLEFPIAEVRFKNSHKDFFLLPQEGVFHVGDIVAVEANSGHDIGIISMLGIQVQRQMENRHVQPEHVTKKLYRTARYADIEEWIATVSLEHDTMLRSRYTAWDLNLKMKVNDVEYQGDGTKAIFYYSAEERVDFRELIKILAEQFHIRIEMRQIGVRQEAARLGGLGSCGRELCCSSWLTNFQSVSTSTARTQQLSLNPQKLAGMCGKLKCCLNFEQETYQQELKEFPSPNVRLKTKKGTGIYNKIDIFKKIVWYSYADDSSTIFALPLDKVKQIIKLNESGKTPDTLEEYASVNQKKMDEDNGGYSMDELKNIADS